MIPSTPSRDAPLGKRRWAISAGCVPSRSNGPEPAFTSRDQFSVLNTGPTLANLRIRVLYERHSPIGTYRLTIAARRVRVFRVNDLIFPEAVRLDEPYGLLIESDCPVVVQFTRHDTRQAANAGMMAMAFSDTSGRSL
ncbi:sensory rhodopsin transducer [Pseudoxanthomonas sp. UTMC 1351]|uniref:sensory rhodopsin transducer n=1 Tax=Pseudoxanthomonas sp. UTMC 1351 TaxID=2695853 RepID=UPI0034CE752B